MSRWPSDARRWIDRAALDAGLPELSPPRAGRWKPGARRHFLVCASLATANLFDCPATASMPQALAMAVAGWNEWGFPSEPAMVTVHRSHPEGPALTVRLDAALAARLRSAQGLGRRCVVQPFATFVHGRVAGRAPADAWVVVGEPGWVTLFGPRSTGGCRLIRKRAVRDLRIRTVAGFIECERPGASSAPARLVICAGRQALLRLRRRHERGPAGWRTGAVALDVPWPEAPDAA